MTNRAGIETPAIFANRVTISLIPNVGMRITFGESPDGTSKDEQDRVAVFLPLAAAHEVKDLFKRVFEQAAMQAPASQSKQ